MPRRLSTVADMVSEIREQLNETNIDSVGTEERILPTMNRALDYARDLSVRRYSDPYVKYTTINLTSGVQEYDIPEDCFEDRIMKVEVYIHGTYEEVRRVSFYDSGRLETPTALAIPPYYCIVGRKIRLLPASTGTYPLRVWYMAATEQLVLPQGRIVVLNEAQNYLIVDSIGDDVSTQSDTLESYVNICDGQTGAIKWTGQVQLLTDNRVQFRTSPIRPTVLDRDVSGDMTTATDPTLDLDDYICNIRGTCIGPDSPTRSFIIEFTVAEITRSLGGDAATEEKVLEKFEKQISTNASGRENTTRVQRRSNAWGRPRRRWFINQ